MSEPNPSLDRTSTGLATRRSWSIIRLAAKPAAAQLYVRRHMEFPPPEQMVARLEAKRHLSIS